MVRSLGPCRVWEPFFLHAGKWTRPARMGIRYLRLDRILKQATDATPNIDELFGDRRDRKKIDDEVLAERAVPWSALTSRVREARDGCAELLEKVDRQLGGEATAKVCFVSVT